jgi:transcriptional regulator GlxA family with amidase domain
MKIVFLLFDRITALDVVGPYEVLARLPGARVVFAAAQAGEIRTDNRALGLMADVALDQVRACDILVVPGGFGTRLLERDQSLLDWLRAIDGTTMITASVCTGSILLAAAGLLERRRANTHWAHRHRLSEHGAIPTAERVVRDGKYATAAGVSAGIDLALRLAMELAGPDVAAAIQLTIEYDPRPPLDCGDATRAPKALRDTIMARARAREEELAEGVDQL